MDKCDNETVYFTLSDTAKDLGISLYSLRKILYKNHCRYIVVSRKTWVDKDTYELLKRLGSRSSFHVF